MDQETIKQLIELFSGMGVDAKEAFIWYLLASRVLPNLLVFAGVFLVCRTIWRIIVALSSCQIIGDAVGDLYWNLELEKRRAITECLRTHYKKNKD